MNGKKAVITVLAVGPSVGAGYKLTGSLSGVSFEDYDDNINPNNFNGFFAVVQAGITFSPGLPIKPPGNSIPPGIGGGVGIGVSYMRLGKAFTTLDGLLGLTVGRDYSVSGSVGSSTVMDSKIVDCNCK